MHQVNTLLPSVKLAFDYICLDMLPCYLALQHEILAKLTNADDYMAVRRVVVQASTKVLFELNKNKRVRL